MVAYSQVTKGSHIFSQKISLISKSYEWVISWNVDGARKCQNECPSKPKLKQTSSNNQRINYNIAICDKYQSFLDFWASPFWIFASGSYDLSPEHRIKRITVQKLMLIYRRRKINRILEVCVFIPRETENVEERNDDYISICKLKFAQKKGK